MNKGINQDKWQWFPLFFGACLSLLTIVIIGVRTVRFGDAGDYIAGAQALLNGLAYPREASLPFFRPPLYPLLIASIWLVLPGSVVAIKLVQSILFGFTCWLLYQLGKVLADGNFRPALIGASLYAVNPFALLQTADIQTECLHTFLIALGLYFLTLLLRSNVLHYRYGLFAGMVFGLASLCRPTALPIGIILAITLIVIVRHVNQPSDYCRSGGVMLSGLLLAILPWSISNLNATGEFILITDGGGYHLWLGNHPAELRLYETRFLSSKEFDNYSYGYLQQELPQETIKEWESSGGYKSLSLKQREARWQQAALQNVRSYPLQTLRLLMYKTLAYWRPWLLLGAYSRQVVLASSVVLIPLFLLALLGINYIYISRNSRSLLVILIVLFIASTIVHTISHVMLRFRLPYVDPYLSVFAGVAIWHLFARIVSSIKSNIVVGPT